MDALLTVGEVAAILKVHTNTVYEKAKNGEIPSVRTANKSVRFIESDIRRWLEGHSRSSVARPLFEDSLQTDLSLVSYDKLFLKGGVKVSPEGKTWNYPFGSVYVRLNKSGQERWNIYYRADGIRIRKERLQLIKKKNGQGWHSRGRQFDPGQLHHRNNPSFKSFSFSLDDPCQGHGIMGCMPITFSGTVVAN